MALKKLIFSSALYALVFLSPGQAVAAEPIFGPVSMTVNTLNYNVFYTTVQYTKIAGNIPGVVSPSIKGSTTNPNTLVGVAAAAPSFMQPWWNPGNSTAAKLAALAWYNAGSYPNQAARFPNQGGSATPFFAYSTDEAGIYINYAKVNSAGVVEDTGKVLVTDIGVAFAVAGVSN